MAETRRQATTNSFNATSLSLRCVTAWHNTYRYTVIKCTTTETPTLLPRTFGLIMIKKRKIRARYLTQTQTSHPAHVATQTRNRLRNTVKPA